MTFFHRRHSLLLRVLRLSGFSCTRVPSAIRCLRFLSVSQFVLVVSPAKTCFLIICNNSGKPRFYKDRLGFLSKHQRRENNQGGNTTATRLCSTRRVQLVHVHVWYGDPFASLELQLCQVVLLTVLGIARLCSTLLKSKRTSQSYPRA